MFEIPVRSNFELHSSLEENFAKIKSKHCQNNLHKAKISRKFHLFSYFQLKGRGGEGEGCVRLRASEELDSGVGRW